MYLAKVDKVLVKVVFVLELCDNSKAGSGSSQRKEQVVALRVDDSAPCGGENLEKHKILSEEEVSLTSVFSAVTSTILPSARTARMLRIFSAP